MIRQGSGRASPAGNRRQFELDDIEAFPQEGDEGKEQRAVEAVLVKIIGSDVRRRNRDAGGKQRAEQSGQNHRVGDIPHREFVEAEEGGLVRELCGDRSDRVVAGRFSSLARLAPFVPARMRVRHEGMEMRASFLRDFDGVEEEVHQHRFAASDRTVDVEAAWRLRRPDPHEARKGARPDVGLVAAKPR